MAAFASRTPAIDLPFEGGPDLVAAIRADPLGVLVDQARRHGDLFAYDAGPHATVVLNRPAFARHVLVDRSERYAKAGTPEIDMLRPVLGEGLMTVEGPEWSAQRALAAPHFSEDALALYAPLMAREIAVALDRWTAPAAAAAGIDVCEALSALTLRIVARCLFAAALSDEEADDVGAGVGALNAFMAAGPVASVGADHGAQAGAMAKMASIVWSIACAPPPVGETRDNLLRALLEREAANSGRGMRAVVDQVMTFVMAGHETTAKTLTWMLYLLSRWPATQEALYAEAVATARCGAYARAARLLRCEEALNEAMRLYPPVWLISRKAVADDVIDGRRIAAGALVVISPYLLHRHSRVWVDAETFDPSRFADGGAARALRDCRFMPFGAGARACIGRRFAMAEMSLALAMLVERFCILTTGDGDVRPEALVTLRPASPVRLRLVPRGPNGGTPS